MIVIDFNRTTRTAAYQDILFTCSSNADNDPYFDLCRILLDNEHPDTSAVFRDERGMDCLTVKSIHSCARRYRPTESDLIARRARKLAMAGLNLLPPPQRKRVAIKGFEDD